MLHMWPGLTTAESTPFLSSYILHLARHRQGVLPSPSNSLHAALKQGFLVRFLNKIMQGHLGQMIKLFNINHCGII